MNTIKITLAALAIAASATSAFAYDSTSGQGDHIKHENSAGTATYVVTTDAPSTVWVAPSYGWVSQGTVDDQADFNHVHINNH